MENERCIKVTQHSHDIAEIIATDPMLAPTTLALMAHGLDPTRQISDQAVSF